MEPFSTSNFQVLSWIMFEYFWYYLLLAQRFDTWVPTTCSQGENDVSTTSFQDPTEPSLHQLHTQLPWDRSEDGKGEKGKGDVSAPLDKAHQDGRTNWVAVKLLAHSQMTAWHRFWHSCLIYILIWHSVWHKFGHSTWNIFWHSIWHTFCHSIWHCAWHISWHFNSHKFWHSICINSAILSNILSDIDILSDININLPSDIHSDILSDIKFASLSDIHSDTLCEIISDIHSDILFEINLDILWHCFWHYIWSKSGLPTGAWSWHISGGGPWEPGAGIYRL